MMERPPNAVLTHRGSIHGNPVNAQHHNTGQKPVETSKEHTCQEGGGRGTGGKAADKLTTDLC